jgi:hypothetical protein
VSKESIIVPIHKAGDKTDCNNYRWISLASTSYKMLLKYPPLAVKSIHR